MKKRILFLISDTGGGHRTAAEAIAEAIQYLYPAKYETIIEDVWKNHTPTPINKLPDAYPWLTGAGKPVWKFLWTVSTQFHLHKFVFWSIYPILKSAVTQYFKSIQPDLIISAHPLMNHLGLKLAKKSRLDIPFVTVITDMVSIHPAWICPEVTRCVAPTYQARNIAMKLGMAEEKIDVCGQPVGLKFSAMPQNKTQVRRKLGLDENRRAVMIMGGGEGYGRVFDISRTIAKNVPQAQIMIVAGRNKRLQNRLKSVNWEVPTQIYGFVDNIPELMNAADILITKAGPGAISEAFIAGLPPLISGFIPGQESGNVRYVQQHQAGAYAEAPQQIAKLVQEWLDPNNNTLQKLAHNASNLAQPKASLAIATNVCGLI